MYVSKYLTIHYTQKQYNRKDNKTAEKMYQFCYGQKFTYGTQAICIYEYNPGKTCRGCNFTAYAAVCFAYSTAAKW